jgi:predicted nucleotidyltransferase
MNEMVSCILAAPYNGTGAMTDVQSRHRMALIEGMARRIATRFRPERIILFGSHAKRAARPDSDADLLVVFRRLDSRRRRAAEIYAHLAGSGLPKDIVVATTRDIRREGRDAGSILRPALRDGRVLYARAT